MIGVFGRPVFMGFFLYINMDEPMIPETYYLINLFLRQNTSNQVIYMLTL